MCKRIDEEEDLVTCDNCDRWFHLGCAKLDHSPGPEEDWLCVRCAADAAELNEAKQALAKFQLELEKRAKAQKSAEVHATSMELELMKHKQELEEKNKTEDSKQDILQGLADVLKK